MLERHFTRTHCSVKRDSVEAEDDAGALSKAALKIRVSPTLPIIEVWRADASSTACPARSHDFVAGSAL